MVMKKFGKTVSKFPRTGIIVIIIVTMLFGTAYFTLGTKMEASEETYMPDNETVKAEMEIEKNYSQTESVTVLVKSDNVLSKDSLKEMLLVEKGFLDDEEINKTLVSEKNPVRITGVADTIIMGKNLFDLIENMNRSFQEKNYLFMMLGSWINRSVNEIRSTSNYSILDNLIFSINSSLNENLTLFSKNGAQDFGSLTEMPILSTDKKIKIISNMSDLEIKNLIKNITCYDNSKTKNINDSVYPALNYANEQMNMLNMILTNLKDDKNLSSDVKTAINSTLNTIHQFTGIICTTSLFVQDATKKLDSAVSLLNTSMKQLLTTDFSTETLKADGTMMIALFNSSDLPDENEKEDRFLMLENRMVDIIKAQNLTSTEMAVMGSEIISDEITNASNESINLLLPIAFILVFIILIITYRNLPDIIFSGSALGFAVIWVYGFGTLAGFTFNPMTIAVPILIAGLGIDFGIHTTLRYREEIREGYKPKEAVNTTVRFIGTALLLSTFTTVVAFLSNVASDMEVLRQFGILCAFGIVSSFITMTTFVPGCKQVLDEHKLKKGKLLKETGNGRWHRVKGSGVTILNKGISAGAVGAEHHPMIVLGIVLIITGASIGLGLNVRTTFDLNDFLPGDLEVTRNINYLMNNFNYSTENANILVKGDMTNPAVLEAMAETINNMDKNRYVLKNAEGKPDVTSILSVMYDVSDDNRLSNPLDLYSEEFKTIYENSDSDGNGIPDKNISALYDWLYTNENTTGVVRIVLHKAGDGTYDGSVIRIGADTENKKKSGELYSELKEDNKPLSKLVENKTINKSVVTGSSVLTYVIIETLNKSMINSMIITMVVAFVTLTIVFYFMKKTFILGFITMIPVLLAMAWILGSMFLLGIPYNVLTITVTALTIGLGIDYAIHITHRFVEDIGRFGDIDEACRYTMRHTGTALFAAALTTISGFGIMVFSLLPPMRQFGAVIALTVLYSFLASVFVLPTMLVLWAKWRKHEKE